MHTTLQTVPAVPALPKAIIPFVSKMVALAAKHGVTLNQDEGLRALDVVREYDAKPYLVATLLGSGFSLTQIEALYGCRDSGPDSDQVSIRLLAEFAQRFEIDDIEELCAAVENVASSTREAFVTVRGNRAWHAKYQRSKSLKLVIRVSRSNDERDLDAVIEMVTSSLLDPDVDQIDYLENLFTGLLEKEDS